ncbi:MAG: hypothetical protein OEZ06_29150 [Myxococcales bacterium]|nr:hypothetical protein [Myxococcales bacterium]
MQLALDPTTRVDCPRCHQVVTPLRPWRHWKTVRMAYFGGLGLALLGAPVILADGFVLIPTLMLYMVAIGPINTLAGQRAVCSRCSCVLE